MQTISKPIRALILTLGIVQPASASVLNGTDPIILEPASGKELLALLDSPDAKVRLAGAYYVFGVLEGHVVTQAKLEICLLEKAVTVDDLVTTVRNNYASYPFLLKEKLASADIINALQKRYPCKK